MAEYYNGSEAAFKDAREKIAWMNWEEIWLSVMFGLFERESELAWYSSPCQFYRNIRTSRSRPFCSTQNQDEPETHSVIQSIEHSSFFPDAQVSSLNFKSKVITISNLQDAFQQGFCCCHYGVYECSQRNTAGWWVSIISKSLDDTY